MTDNLDTLSDAELSEAFAVEVAGWTRGPMFPNHPTVDSLVWRDETLALVYDCDRRFGGPNFATSADAVLPWLEKHHPVIRYRVGLGNKVFWDVDINVVADGRAPTFPRAACIALIRAHRAQKSL